MSSGPDNVLFEVQKRDFFSVSVRFTHARKILKYGIVQHIYGTASLLKGCCDTPVAPSWTNRLCANSSFVSKRMQLSAFRPLLRSRLSVCRRFPRVGAPFENRRFSGDSGVVSIRSKFRERLFDAAKRFRSSNRPENAREAPFSAILAIDRFRTAPGRLSRRHGRFFASSSTPFRFRLPIGAPFWEIVVFLRSRTSEGVC